MNMTTVLLNNRTEETSEAFWTVVKIHVVAMVNLSCSIVISLCVIGYMLRTTQSIFKCPIGERLVFYLASADLCFSTAHLVDHASVLYLDNAPPPAMCTVLAFFMTSFINSPCIVTLVTAINAFFMVVLQRKLDLGKYDWKLLVGAFFNPCLVQLTFALFGWLGYNGAWCGFNPRTTQGRFLGQLNAILTIVIFFINLVCYAFIWWKIRSVVKHLQVNQSGKGPESATKYHKSAKVMMIFIVSYVLQYWAIAAFYTWEFFGIPPVPIVFSVVLFTNQGGLFNFLAYTYVRKKYSSRGALRR